MIQTIETWTGFFLFCINKVNSTWEAQQEHPKIVHPKKVYTSKVKKAVKTMNSHLKKLS